MISYSQDHWDFERCITYMKENNISIKGSRLDIDLAELEYIKSRTDFLPTLGFTVSSNIGLGRSIDPLTNNFTNEPVSSVGGGFDISYTVFDGFKKWYDLRKNKLEVHKKKWNYQLTERDTRIVLANLYFRILFLQEQLQNTRTQLEISETQLSVVQELVDSGRKPKSDFLNQESFVLDTRLELNTLENTLVDTYEELRILLQLPEQEQLNVTSLYLDDYTIEMDDPEYLKELLSKAKKIPELNINEASIKQAKLDYKYAKKTYLPKLSVTYGFSSLTISNSVTFLPQEGTESISIDQIGFVSSDGGVTRGDAVFTQNIILPEDQVIKTSIQDQLKNNFSQSIGISLDIPFLSSNTFLERNSKRAKIRLDQAKLEFESTSDQIGQKLKEIANDVKLASNTFRIAQKKKETSEEAFRITKGLYSFGQLSFYEYRTSQIEYRKSLYQLTKAKFDYILKDKILKAYLGTPLTF